MIDTDVFTKIDNNEPLHYKLTFPVQNPVPWINEIIVNGKIICQGPKGNISTTLPFFYLQNTYYYRLR